MTFTDEQIQGFKVKSAKEHDGRVLQIDIGEPVNATLVVAPFNRAEWAAFVDRRKRDAQTAFHGAVIQQLLHPSLQELEAMRRDWATLAEKVVSELNLEAGWTPEDPVFRPLDVAAPPAGLSPEKAAEIVAANKGARLWSLELPAHDLALVMKTPISDTWLGARTHERDAEEKCSGIIAATEPYVFGSVIWQNQALIGGTGILDRKPALYWELLACYRVMGGYGAAVRRKSL